MRVTLLHVVSLLALVTSSLGDSVATSPRVCTIQLDDDTNMLEKMKNMQLNCFKTFYEQFAELVTLQEHRTFFKTMCEKKQEIRDCLVEIELTSEVCQNAASHQNLKMYNNLFEITLNSGCVDDGEVLAYTTTTYKASPNDPFHSDPFHDYILTALVRQAYNSDLEKSSIFYVMYREVHNIKDWFGNVEGSDYLATQVTPILSEIINKMECVHPQDGTTVLCKTIDITLPDVPRLCPIKSQDVKTVSSLYDILNEQVGSCLTSPIFQPEMATKIDEIQNVDMARVFMKNFCRKKSLFDQCWSDAMTTSSVCLDGTQQNKIKVAVDLIRKPVDYACREEGQSLGYVLNKVMSEKNNTEGSKGALGECKEVANRLDEGLDQLLGGVVLMEYRRLKVFKECFVNKMRGDNTAVLISMQLLNSVQRNMNCVDKQNGNIVLCETIDTTPETGNNVCPLVGVEENEPPEYELIVDQGFKCLRRDLKKNFDRFDATTTIEEFRTYFNTFCHNRLALKHCFEDVTSLSKICQNQTNHQMLSIFTDFLETTLENGCKQDGEAMAIILHGFKSGPAIDRDQIITCLDNVAIQIRITSLNVEDLSNQTLLVYRSFESLKECVVIGSVDVDTFKTVFVSSVNDILRNLKCIHPDGTIVLCEIIVNN